MIALYQPEMAPNVGTIIRTCACFGVPLHIIHPIGFIWSDKHLRRASMDYQEYAHVLHHDDIEAFMQAQSHRRILLMDPPREGTHTLWSFPIQPEDILLFGQEGAGFPDSLRARIPTRLSIPIAPHTRSLNLAISVGVALGCYGQQQSQGFVL